MRKTLTLSLAAAAALLAGGVAYAQPGPDESRSALTRAAVEQRTVEAFARMDVNDDGVLNDADREARLQQVFASIDADGDGAISPAEFAARRDDRRAESAEHRGPGGRHFAGRGMRGPDKVRAADADGDGAITETEFATVALARFDRADADKDGTITREERRLERRDMRHDRHDRHDQRRQG